MALTEEVALKKKINTPRKITAYPRNVGFSVIYFMLVWCIPQVHLTENHLDLMSKSKWLFHPHSLNCSQMQVFLVISTVASWTLGTSTGHMVSLL